MSTKKQSISTRSRTAGNENLTKTATTSPQSRPKPTMAAVPPATPAPASRKRALPRGELNSPGISPLRIIFDPEGDNSEVAFKSSEGDELVVAVSEDSDGQRSVRRRVSMQRSDMDSFPVSSPNLSPIRPDYDDDDVYAAYLQRKKDQDYLEARLTSKVTSRMVLRSPPKVVLHKAIQEMENSLQLLKALYGHMDSEDRDNESSESSSDDIRVD